MRDISKQSTEQLKALVEKEVKKAKPNRTVVMECLQELKSRDPEGVPDKILISWEASQQCKRRSASKAWKRIVAVAAIIAVILLVTIPDVCGEENVIQLVGRWTKNIFSFGEIHEHKFVYQTDHPGLQELYDTVTDLGAERNVVPTWIPADYKLDQIEVIKKTNDNTVTASYTNGQAYIAFSITVFDEVLETEYQKGVEDVELFETNGVKHYIMENDATWTAVWAVDNMECFLSADTEDNLKKIVHSIYESEMVT